MPKAAKRKAPAVVVKRAKPKPHSSRRKTVTDKDKDTHKPAEKPAEKAPPEANTSLPPEAYMTEQEKAGQQAPVTDEAPKKKETK